MSTSLQHSTDVRPMRHCEWSFELPFQSESQPSARNRPSCLTMPHVPSALPMGITYSGIVPSSRTDCLTTYPCSSAKRGAGNGLDSRVLGSAKYESFSFDESLSCNAHKSCLLINQGNLSISDGDWNDEPLPPLPRCLSLTPHRAPLRPCPEEPTGPAIASFRHPMA